MLPLIDNCRAGAGTGGTGGASPARNLPHFITAASCGQSPGGIFRANNDRRIHVNSGVLYKPVKIWNARIEFGAFGVYRDIPRLYDGRDAFRASGRRGEVARDHRSIYRPCVRGPDDRIFLPQRRPRQDQGDGISADGAVSRRAGRVHRPTAGSGARQAPDHGRAVRAAAENSPRHAGRLSGSRRGARRLARAQRAAARTDRAQSRLRLRPRRGAEKTRSGLLAERGVKLKKIYAGPEKVFSIEFFPPKTEKGDESLFREIDSLKSLNPAFCSVTYGAGGSTRERTVDLVDRIHRECGLAGMCHLTVVGQSKDRVRSVLERLKEKRIENLIALSGDPPQGVTDWRPHSDGFRHSIELVREALAYGCFSIAVAGFPEVHPRAKSREEDLRYLKEKVDAGADVIITQLFFDNDHFFRFADDLRRLGVKVPIVPGMLPILSTAQVRRFTALCGAKIPAPLEERLARVDGDDEAAVELGIEYATEQCRALLDAGVPGIHFYSLNKARSVRAIFNNLGLGR